MTTLEKVKAKIIEAVPEIVELTFGCECLIQGLHYYFVTKDGAGRFRFLRGYEGSIIGEEWFETLPSSFFSIIGRPITLEDVLRAMLHFSASLNYSISASGHFLRVKSWNERERLHELVDVQWTLGKPLEDQSPETIEFLANVLDV